MDLLVEWRFEPSQEEKASITQLVAVLERSAGAPDSGAVGVLYRFASKDRPGRYLLMTFLPKGPLGSARQAAVYALANGQNQRVSSPFVIGTDALGGFGVERIADYDGDGFPDVAYCEWPETEAADGTPRVVGNRDGNWYRITSYRQAPPTCSASGEDKISGQPQTRMEAKVD